MITKHGYHNIQQNLGFRNKLYAYMLCQSKYNVQQTYIRPVYSLHNKVVPHQSDLNSPLPFFFWSILFTINKCSINLKKIKFEITIASVAKSSSDKLHYMVNLSKDVNDRNKNNAIFPILLQIPIKNSTCTTFL